MHEKEKVYDEQISPLLLQIIDICDEHNIQLYTEFEIGDEYDDMCFTRIGKIKQQSLEALSKSWQSGGFNIDKFIFWILKTFNVEHSIFLHDKNQIKKEE